MGAVQEEHWALQHEAMVAVLAYMRSTASGDFRAVVPRAVHDPGAHAGPEPCFTTCPAIRALEPPSKFLCTCRMPWLLARLPRSHHHAVM